MGSEKNVGILNILLCCIYIYPTAGSLDADINIYLSCIRTSHLMFLLRKKFSLGIYGDSNQKSCVYVVLKARKRQLLGRSGQIRADDPDHP